MLADSSLHERSDFKALVEHYAQEIVNKWVEYFVLHKKVEPKRITRRIK